MNILLVSGPGISLKEPYQSGIEAFIVLLANELVNEGHTVDVIAAEADAGTRFKIINPLAASVSGLCDLDQLAEEKRQFLALDVSAYDVIHYHMFYPHLLQAGQHFNKPSFLTLHSPADEKRVLAYQELSQQSDVVFVAISERIKNQWDAALGLDIRLISNGIDLDLWPIRNSMDREYLLWSARINEEKNLSAAISLAQHLQLPLMIAGRIVDQQYFDKQVQPHLNDHIQYVGHLTQRELSKLANKAIAYLATATWQEPFGLASLEMLATGLPVIGFQTAVPPDWRHESILTTSSLRWQDLAELVGQSKTITAATCRAFATTMNVQKMTSDYIRLYRETIYAKPIDLTYEDCCYSQNEITDL